MNYDEMRAMEKTHVCAQCETPLVTIWNMLDEDYSLVCAFDHNHQGYQQILSVSQELARGTLGDKLGENSQEELEKMAENRVTAITKLLDKDLATNEGLARDKLLALVHWGTELALKPYLGHVCLYHGNPYVTIDGYYYLLYKAQRSIDIGTRPLTTSEREDYKINEGDYTWKAEAWENGKRLPTTGLGIVTQEEVEGKSVRHPEQFRAPVVHGHPQRMAEKRAEWQLLRKLIPLEVKE